MAKIKTEEDLLKDDARNLIDRFNQIIKGLTSMVYFDFDGSIYLKSESTKYERFARYYDKESMPVRFCGAMYNTLELAEFRKEYRYSTSTVLPLQDKLVIGQTEKSKSPNAKFDINILHDNTDHDKAENIKFNIIYPEFYKKFPSLVPDFELNDGFTSIPDEELDSLEEGDMIFIEDFSEGKSIHAYFTKAIFPNISKTDTLEYKILNERNPLDEKCAYIVLKETLKNFGLEVFTLISAYQSI